MSLSRRLCCALIAAASPAAMAVVAYDESVLGDFANSGLTPTAVSFVVGSNQIFGSSGNPGTGADRDYFTFTLPAGLELVSLTVLPGSTFLGPGALSFIAVQAGNQVTVNPTGGSAAGLLGWSHYTAADINTNILPEIGLGGGATGFVPPLPAGSYAFWIQETGAGTSAYRFDFAVAVVPEPASAAFMLAGLAGLSLLRWRRSAAFNAR